MLIFIENTPRPYAWGSKGALPDMLGTPPTGEPQAELWLGDHPGSPATVAKPAPARRTLIDLIVSDPDRYGVDGGHLPFLLKVLAIEAPLSLQVHPDPEQAAAGYDAEEAAGVPLDAPERNYGDRNHKPELLVALTEVRALSGFRPLLAVRGELAALAARCRSAGDPDGALALETAALRLAGPGAEGRRRAFLDWAFSGDPLVARALGALGALLGDGARPGGRDAGSEAHEDDGGTGADARGVEPARVDALRELLRTHPGDPGVLVSLLLHLVHLSPGEAVYLRARQIHAYLGGVAVEVMAASDNVLRAGLTEKHVDIAELCRVVDPGELDEPRFPCERLAPGLVAWRPDVPDFQLLRARLCDPEESGAEEPSLPESAPEVRVPAPRPVVLVATSGRVRVERPAAELAEVANVRRGQSLYISAGEPVLLTGHGEVFLATVGERAEPRPAG